MVTIVVLFHASGYYTGLHVALVVDFIRNLCSKYCLYIIALGVIVIHLNELLYYKAFIIIQKKYLHMCV